MDEVDGLLGGGVDGSGCGEVVLEGLGAGDGPDLPSAGRPAGLLWGSGWARVFFLAAGRVESVVRF